jgi:hypothetical protein
MDVTESSPLLGTPRAAHGMQNPIRDAENVRDGDARARLEDQVALKLLATPTAWLGRRPSQMEGDADRWHDPARSNELSDQMAAIHLLPTPTGKLLPTPVAGDGREKGGGGRWNPTSAPLEQTIKDEMRLLPTPTVNDAGNSTAPPSQADRNSLALPSLLSGASTSPPSGDGKPSTAPRPRLSPEFVEWMMGTPRCNECGRGWTDNACPHSAMAFTSTSDGSSGTRS